MRTDIDENDLIQKMNREYHESLLKRISALNKKHEEVKNEYAKIFCEIMGLDDDWAYFSGTIYCVCDYFIDMKTIVWAVNNLVDEETFFNWYDYNLSLGEYKLGEISLEEYCNGKKVFSEEELASLKEAKKKVFESENIFEDLLLEIQKKHS